MMRDGAPLGVTLKPIMNGFGENTLVWLPDGIGERESWPRPAADTVFQVEVQNVGIAGSFYDFQYQVVVFDPTIAAGPTGPLDIDNDGSTQALTDGLLVVRSLFGFTGQSLVQGAVSGSCQRCGATEIQSYIEGLTPDLDCDGDGMVEALTDGLLVMRYLFGFRGSSLTQGALGSSCTRCSAASIEAYIQELL